MPDKESDRDDIAAAIAEAPPSEDRFFRPYAHFDVEDETTDRSSSESAFGRLFGTSTGKRAVGLVGNETRTLNLMSTIAAQVVIDGLRLDTDNSVQTDVGADASTGMRPLIVHNESKPGISGGSVTILLLDPQHEGGPVRFTSDMQEDRLVPAAYLEQLVRRMGPADPTVGLLVRMLADNGSQAGASLLWITQPEIVVARAPVMELVSCPSPALQVNCIKPDGRMETSSVGMFCRNASGVAGLTACHHGTGPAGTKIKVGGMPTIVTQADQIQDLIFAPLPHGYVVPNFASGLGWARADRSPYQGEAVAFDGCTSGQKTTVVTSHGPGLLWRDPLSQNKVQTPPSVDKGDSGSALIDTDDKILGFAFRRTAFGELINFAEWIWADNALAALDLRPL